MSDWYFYTITFIWRGLSPGSQLLGVLDPSVVLPGRPVIFYLLSPIWRMWRHDKVGSRHGTSAPDIWPAGWSGWGWGWTGLIRSSPAPWIIGEMGGRGGCLTRDGSSHYNFLNCSQPTLSLILLPSPSCHQRHRRHHWLPYVCKTSSQSNSEFATRTFCPLDLCLSWRRNVRWLVRWWGVKASEDCRTGLQIVNWWGMSSFLWRLQFNVRLSRTCQTVRVRWRLKLLNILLHFRHYTEEQDRPDNDTNSN